MVRNQKEAVPFAFYEGRFRSLSPEEATTRLQDAKWDGKEFYVNLIGRTYAISHPDYAIRTLDGGNVPTLTVQTFLLRYLLECRDMEGTGAWKTFRELPWGETYAAAFAGRALTRAAFSFGTRLDAFRTACEKMGAVPVQHGDAGYQFTFLGGYQMRLLLWEGDEDFPPSAQILFSDNFAAGFTAEDRAVAGDILIASIKSRM